MACKPPPMMSGWLAISYNRRSRAPKAACSKFEATTSPTEGFAPAIPAPDGPSRRLPSFQRSNLAGGSPEINMRRRISVVPGAGRCRAVAGTTHPGGALEGLGMSAVLTELKRRAIASPDHKPVNGRARACRLAGQGRGLAACASGWPGCVGGRVAGVWVGWVPLVGGSGLGG